MENDVNIHEDVKMIKDELFTGHLPIPINIVIKVMKSICKIIIYKHDKKLYGTGFFMKVDISKKYLITNYHVISPDTINDTIEIEIYNQKKKKLEFNNRYVKYFPKPKVITIIEIKNTDEIYKDIQLLNYDLNFKQGYEIYKGVDIFSIEHPSGDNAACASGKVINIDNFEFAHNIPTDNGSSGCPIILLNNIKIL